MTLSERIAAALTRYGELSAADIALLLSVPTWQVRAALESPRFEAHPIEDRPETTGYSLAA